MATAQLTAAAAALEALRTRVHPGLTGSGGGARSSTAVPARGGGSLFCAPLGNAMLTVNVEAHCLCSAPEVQDPLRWDQVRPCDAGGAPGSRPRHHILEQQQQKQQQQQRGGHAVNSYTGGSAKSLCNCCCRCRPAPPAPQGAHSRQLNPIAAQRSPAPPWTAVTAWIASPALCGRPLSSC